VGDEANDSGNGEVAMPWRHGGTDVRCFCKTSLRLRHNYSRIITGEKSRVFNEISGTVTKEKPCVQHLRYDNRRKVLCSTRLPVRRRKKSPVFNEFSGKETEDKSCVQRDLRYGNGRKVLCVQRGFW
jgi:hypothetical protein